MKNKNAYRELVKNDPNFHDIRAKILLEAAGELKKLAEEQYGIQPAQTSWLEASAQLRRMASNARRAHKKVQDERRAQQRGSEAKAKAFGY